jgi:E3 ubiquitin-protein ligase HERC2
VFLWCIGKLGHGSEENINIPCIIPTLEDVTIISISAGCEHSAAISEDGVLYTWGHGDGGRLGHGDSDPLSIPTPVLALKQMHVRYDVKLSCYLVNDSLFCLGL